MWTQTKPNRTDIISVQFGVRSRFELEWVEFSNPIELQPKLKSEQPEPKSDLPTPKFRVGTCANTIIFISIKN